MSPYLRLRQVRQKISRSEVSRCSVRAEDLPMAFVFGPVLLFRKANGLQDEEVLHLPPLVSSAESSPPAAAAAARQVRLYSSERFSHNLTSFTQIRKFLSKDYFSRAHVQYNAIMLIRILAQNPGESFTRNIDQKFTDNFHYLLRHQRDPSVQQIAHETLAGLKRDGASLDGVDRLLEMYSKEKANRPHLMAPQRPSAYHRGSSHHSDSNNLRRLPSAHELAQRISEARNSATLLTQLVTTTPSAELISGNELIVEFADRCKSAQASMQQLMDCTDPAPPDEDTFQTLIETYEQLTAALSKHQRALLAARRTMSPAATRQEEYLAPVTTHGYDEAEEGEAGGSKRLTEEEQLRMLNVRDDNFEEQQTSRQTDPFADNNGQGEGYLSYQQQLPAFPSKNKGKGASFVSPSSTMHAPDSYHQPPYPPTVPNISSTQPPRRQPYTEDFETFAASPPPLPPHASSKPDRPPPPAARETEILSNAYQPSLYNSSPDYAAPSGPPPDRAELPADSAHEPAARTNSQTNGQNDSWSGMRDHWAGVKGGAQASSPIRQELGNIEEDEAQHTTQHSQSQHQPQYMSGAVQHTEPSVATSPQQMRSTPQRRPPPVPKMRLTKEALEGVDGGDGDGRWGEDSYVVYQGEKRREREV
jgi:hypothetical protein